MVSGLLRDALQSATTRTDIDINQVALAEPDPDAPTKKKLTPLVEIALDYLVKGATLDFTGDRTLIDTRPLSSQGGKNVLVIDMHTLEKSIRTLPSLLKEVLKTDLVRYWNDLAYTAPATGEQLNSVPINRRQWFSDILRDNLRITGLKHAGLDTLQRATLDQVVRYPHKSMRPHSAGDTGASAFTLYTGLQHDPDSWGAYRDDLLITRTVNGRDVVLLCKPNGEVQSFVSIAAFKKAWRQELEEQLPLDQLNVDLVEPEGSIFDAQADNVLHQNLRNIDFLPLPEPGQGAQDLAHQFFQASDPTVGVATATRTDPQVVEKFRKALPNWLLHAVDHDRYAYRSMGLALASTIHRNQGRSYNHGIPEIEVFAQQQLDAKLPKGYATKDLSVVFKVAVGTLGSGYIERETKTLTEMALQNLAGMPKGEMEVYHRGQRVPLLESGGLLKRLVQEVDIGKAYPALIKQTLLGASNDTQERRALFAERLSIELPLQALTLALQKDSGFSASSYRYVKAIVNTENGGNLVDGKAITLRPLAFLREPGAQPDVVANMFLIEPKDTNAGPHILYRPLISDSPLLEFPTRKALMDAITQPGKLQKSVLAWLPDQKTRDVYDHNGFHEPHIHHFNATDEFPTYRAAQPAALAADGYTTADRLARALENGKLMDVLYDANAHSLTSLAEQQSVSDSENRWATLQEGGFLVLNAVLPFLRAPGMVIGTMMQISAIQKDLEVLDTANGTDTSGPMVDLLLNAVLALGHLSSNPTPVTIQSNDTLSAPGLPDTVVSDGSANTSESPTRMLPDDINDALKNPHQHPRTRLVDLINSFEVSEPPSYLPISEGRLKGLYRIDGKLYAKANEKWYRVGADLDQVFLLDGNDKSRTGPFLQRSVDGDWAFKKVGLLEGGVNSSAADEAITTRFKEGEAARTLQNKKVDISKKLLNTALEEYTTERAQLYQKWSTIDTPQPDSAALTRYQAQQSLTEASRVKLQKMLDTYHSHLNESHALGRSAIGVLTPKSSTEQSSFFQKQRSELFLKMFDDLADIKNVYETLADENARATDGEPMASITEQLKNKQLSAYEKLVSTLGKNVEQEERFLQYLGRRTELLAEWAADSPIGKEHAKYRRQWLNAAIALRVNDETFRAKITAARKIYSLAHKAAESEPSNNLPQIEKDQAAAKIMILAAQREVERLNAKLAINKSNINLNIGKQKKLTLLNQEKDDLAVSMVRARLELDLQITKQELYDSELELEKTVSDTSLKEAIKLARKNIDEIKRRLGTPHIINMLAKERKYSTADFERIPDSYANEAFNLKIDSLASLKELSINRPEPVRPEDREVVSRTSKAPLGPALKLHEELLTGDDFSVEERTSALTRLIDTYDTLLNDRRQLKNAGSPSIRPRYNDLLIERIEELLKNAQEQQDALNQAERDSKLSQPSTSSQSTHRQPPAKPNKPGSHPGRRTSPAYVEPSENVIEPPIRVVEPVSPTLSLNTLKAMGKKLIEQWQQQERLVVAQKKKLDRPEELQNIQPLDWDDMLGRPASHLQDLANKTEAKHGGDPAFAALIQQWRAEAKNLQNTMYEHVRDGYVLQSPKAANVGYLANQGLVTLEPNPRVFRTLAGDVFTEIAVRDVRPPHKVLWYAHFHYATEEDATTHPRDFTAAHLKLPSQRKLTQQDLNRIAGKNNPADAIVRARIAPEQADIFLATQA